MANKKIPRYLVTVLGRSRSQLWYLAKNAKSYYYENPQPKMNRDWTPVFKGGIQQFRMTTPARGQLKQVQECIKNTFLKGKTLPESVHGGVKGWSPAKHAAIHLGKKFHFITDIRGFYPSVTPPMVYQVFRRLGHEGPAASLLTYLTTIDYGLPQGTTTSPYLANLAFAPIDIQLENLCNALGVVYGRWVDDLAFSADHDFSYSIPEILGCIQGHFRIAHRKTTYKAGPIEIIGVVVRNNVLEVPAEKLTLLEQAEYAPTRLGSLASYVLSVNPSCTVAHAYIDQSTNSVEFTALS